MQLKGRVDPLKVAELDEQEFQTLFRAVDLIQSNQGLSDCLQAVAFRLMRKVGAKVMSPNCMKMAAVQLSSCRRLISSLRTLSI